HSLSLSIHCPLHPPPTPVTYSLSLHDALPISRSTGVRLLPGDRAAATWTSSASLEHPGLVGRPGLTNRAGGRAADGLTDSVAYILIAANATNLPGALTRRGRGGSRASDGG